MDLKYILYEAQYIMFLSSPVHVQKNFHIVELEYRIHHCGCQGCGRIRQSILVQLHVLCPSSRYLRRLTKRSRSSV